SDRNRRWSFWHLQALRLYGPVCGPRRGSSAFDVFSVLPFAFPPTCPIVMPPRVASLFTEFALRIEVADAAALAASRGIKHRVDQRRFARIHGLVHGAFEIVRGRRVDAHAAEALHHLVVARALHEHGWRRV